MSGAGPILLAEGLTVSFPRSDGSVLTAVSDFGLEMSAGEIVGLLGETGCGKSTAAAALMGLVKRPGIIEGGVVRLLGRNMLAIPEAERVAVRGPGIALIAQSPRTSLHPLLNVGTQIANVFLAHNQMSRREARGRAIALLRSLGINDPVRRAAAYPHELSTGTIQRVLIAMATCSSPRVLIADEPTSGIDASTQEQILDRIRDNARQTGSAVLLITQDLGILLNYCDAVLIMMNGAVVERANMQAFAASYQGHHKRRLTSSHGGPETTIGPSLSSAASSSPLVEVVDITKCFPLRGSRKKVHAVDGVSFSLRRGECLGLIGESGSGKTTLGRCLLGLEMPTSGDVRLWGRALSSMGSANLRRLRAKMQIVFQDPLDSMNPRWSVGDIVGELLRLHVDLDAAARERRVDGLLDLVGLEMSVKFVRPGLLSAGQQQRVAIARALAVDPEFVVLDEPTSALTREAAAEILSLLKRLSQTLDLACLYISHDLMTVQDFCDRIAVMYLGQIVELGTREQIFEGSIHPYTLALLASRLIPDVAVPRVKRAESIKLQGEIPSVIDLPRGCYLFGRCPMQQPRCGEERQVLTAMPDGRQVRCWRAVAGETAGSIMTTI